MKWKKDHNIAKLNGPGTLEQLELSEQSGMGIGFDKKCHKANSNCDDSDDELLLKKPRLEGDGYNSPGDPSMERNVLSAGNYPSQHHSRIAGPPPTMHDSCRVSQQKANTDSVRENLLALSGRCASELQSKQAWPSEKDVSSMSFLEHQSTDGQSNNMMFLRDCEDAWRS